MLADVSLFVRIGLTPRFSAFSWFWREGQCALAFCISWQFVHFRIVRIFFRVLLHMYSIFDADARQRIWLKVGARFSLFSNPPFLLEALE
jgi:hypothetical protein